MQWLLTRLHQLVSATNMATVFQISMFGARMTAWLCLQALWDLLRCNGEGLAAMLLQQAHAADAEAQQLQEQLAIAAAVSDMEADADTLAKAHQLFLEKVRGSRRCRRCSCSSR
jgi:hypothetical protein